MKKIVSTSQVAHLWANQAQSNASNSNRLFYFYGREIFSYGNNFCIAKILDNGTILFTNRSYSKTKAEHKNKVRRAISDRVKIVYCANPNEGTSSNIPDFTRQIKNQIEIIENASKREQTKKAAKLELARIVENIDNYLLAIDKTHSDLFDSEFEVYYRTAKSLDLAALNSQLEQWRKEKEERERLAAIRAEKEAKKEIAAWKKGQNVYLPNNLSNIYLRAKGEILQTSMGAEVTLNRAKILFELIKGGKDIKGFDIDGFTVIGINGVLTIGCHKIERKEINRFAALQGWGKIPSA